MPVVDSYGARNYTHAMSKRLQVLLDEKELSQLRKVSRAKRTTVAEWVRESIRMRMQNEAEEPVEQRLAKVLGFARYAGPAADINQILAEIEKGRGL